MGKVWVLREPRRGDREWNIYALREAARLKRWFHGVYYSPQLRRLLAVFKPTPGTHVNRLVFEELPESVLRDAYRMECPEGCNRCCVIHSGAFMLDVEAKMLPPSIREIVEQQPRETLHTPGGKVRVYRLDTEPMGRCIFFDVAKGRCMLEEKLGRHMKPIVCLLTYCTVFASRGGKLYLKTGYRVTRDGVEIFYREASREGWSRMVQRMGSVWRKYRRIYLAAAQEGAAEEKRTTSSLKEAAGRPRRALR
jgi:hypothetical protein